MVSLGSVVLGALLSWRLMTEAAGGALTVYPVGNWPAPFGIVLVVDHLSAMMLALTWTIAVPVLWYATGGWDAHGRHFHPMFHFQLMGLSGAFVTGDLFNLFVFFEVLLIASYVLMVHGLGRERFKMGLQYVVLNLVASALFLIGLSIIYDFAGGFWPQGGHRATLHVAARHLCRLQRASSGPVCPHDQGGGLQHHPGPWRDSG
jgi:multicomponent K+:H+ antiporter subunit D